MRDLFVVFHHSEGVIAKTRLLSSKSRNQMSNFRNWVSHVVYFCCEVTSRFSRSTNQGTASLGIQRKGPCVIDLDIFGGKFTSVRELV